jgi:hypothetical protein
MRVMRMVERVLVRFAGAGSGRGGLSWGQQTIWRQFEAIGRPVWLTGLKEKPQSWTVEDAADELAFIMSRHQSMRTRLEVTGDQPVRQIVYDCGQIHLDVIDATAQDDPLHVAADLQKRWEEHDLVYDYANDWPVRMALIRHQGKAAYIVRAVSHVVTDGFGALAMYNDILSRDPVTGSPSGPITSMEPLEQAEWQASPAGRRRSQLSERHWERLLRTIPARRFGQPAGQEGCSRYGRLTFGSRAAYLAVRAIVARTGLASSSVLLAAVATGMARATGVNPLVPRVQVSNRFRPRLATTVSPVSQSCPCVIDIAGLSFDEAVKRAQVASLVAGKHAYFEPARIRELVAAVSDERGEQMDLSFVYNDIRIGTRDLAAAPPPEPRDVQAALPLTKIGWEDRQDPQFPCVIEFEDSPDTIHAVMAIDTHCVGRAQAQACLSEMEAVLVAAAFDAGVPTGI